MTDKTTIEALDTEKPAEENYMVLLDAIFDAIKENGIKNHPTKGMFLTSESIDACLPIIQQYAETYHAEHDKSASEEAEPDDHATDEAWWVARKVYDGIKADLSRLPDTHVFNPFASACLIQQYAESYHAARCKEESAAILAASDRLGAALDESDKVR